jgi:hypothetical protein
MSGARLAAGLALGCAAVVLFSGLAAYLRPWSLRRQGLHRLSDDPEWGPVVQETVSLAQVRADVVAGRGLADLSLWQSKGQPLLVVLEETMVAEGPSQRARVALVRSVAAAHLGHARARWLGEVASVLLLGLCLWSAAFIDIPWPVTVTMAASAWFALRRVLLVVPIERRLTYAQDRAAARWLGAEMVVAGLRATPAGEAPISRLRQWTRRFTDATPSLDLRLQRLVAEKGPPR